jgi:hypothetical protein
VGTLRHPKGSCDDDLVLLPAAPTTQLAAPVVRAVAPNPSAPILINFLLVCMLLIFRIFEILDAIQTLNKSN